MTSRLHGEHLLFPVASDLTLLRRFLCSLPKLYSFRTILIGPVSSRSNMAIPQVNLDNYSVYSHLSDEELLQIAVERSLAGKRLPTDADQSTSSAVAATLSSSSASSFSASPCLTQTYTNPRWTHRDPPRHLYYVCPSHTRPPDHPDFPNCANPPTALSWFLYRAHKK